MVWSRTRPLVGAVLLLVLVLTACGNPFPADPDDTLHRVRGATLRVGLSPHPPWTTVDPDGRPSGREVDLVSEFADRLDAEVSFLVGGEEQLVTRLGQGELDLVIGGLTADTPWSDKVAVTRPYVRTVDTVGEPVELVMAAPMGENAFLRSLETFLHATVPAP